MPALHRLRDREDNDGGSSQAGTSCDFVQLKAGCSCGRHSEQGPPCELHQGNVELDASPCGGSTCFLQENEKWPSSAQQETCWGTLTADDQPCAWDRVLKQETPSPSIGWQIRQNPCWVFVQRKAIFNRGTGWSLVVRHPPWHRGRRNPKHHESIVHVQFL